MHFRQGHLAKASAMAAVAATLTFSTVSYWGPVLPGILGCGALNAFIMVLSGHLLNNAAKPVPRLVSALCAIMFLVAAVLSKRFVKSKWSLADRIALLGAMAFLVAGAMDEALFLGATAGMVCCIGLSWLVSRPSSAQTRKSTV